MERLAVSSTRRGLTEPWVPQSKDMYCGPGLVALWPGVTGCVPQGLYFCTAGLQGSPVVPGNHPDSLTWLCWAGDFAFC